MVSVIIPAYNEENNIRQTIREAKKHELIKEVIVVDDGSEDNTSKEAEKEANRVIKLPQNEGKATALDYGVANAKNEIVCFLDADLKNINQESLSDLINPVYKDNYDMFVGICGRDKNRLSRLLVFLPVLGGQRTLKKSLWNDIPPVYKKDFQIEIALNYFTKVTGRKMGVTVLKKLDHIPKEKKYGVISGFFSRVQMIADIIKVSITLYMYETSKRKLKSLFEYF
ncbi:MAG: glycosyltransferase family 2 protein [Candidatus Magasanikbacteria bacterium]